MNATTINTGNEYPSGSHSFGGSGPFRVRWVSHDGTARQEHRFTSAEEAREWAAKWREAGDGKVGMSRNCN